MSPNIRMETRRKRKINDDPVQLQSNLPEALKTREKEFDIIKGFLQENMSSKSNGYLFISGEPGSGKTATVHRVIERLNEENDQSSNNFQFIEINGLYLSEPSKAYSRILEQMTEEIATPKQALSSLNSIFTSRSTKNHPVILFIDELDCIYNKSANVIINILQWYLIKKSQLILMTIANDDVLISSLKNKFTKEIKISELIFPPYSCSDLETIVEDRLQDKEFDLEVIKFVMKKCVKKEGDARIALDICGRILDKLENNENQITLEVVQKICEEISSDHVTVTIKTLAPVQKVLLRVVRDECTVEESSLDEKIYFLCKGVCTIEGLRCPSITQLCSTAEVLSRMGFLKVSDARVNIHSKIRLNIPGEYVNTAFHMTE
ncbi:origin recognition complex subunit 1 [Planococcus citri]|uniref:origin recognition complex subunit 1 n=1 Tax=Planococcus citri TaxID=170843 RepID=UPI0031F9CD79